MNPERSNDTRIVSRTPSGAFHLDDLVSEMVELERHRVAAAPYQRSAPMPAAREPRNPVARSLASARVVVGAAMLLSAGIVGLIAVHP